MIFVRIVVLLFLAVYSFHMGTKEGALTGFEVLISLIFFVAAPALYFLPTFEAWKRDHPKLRTIILTNLLSGWTVIGWVVSLMLARSNTRSKRMEVVRIAPLTNIKKVPLSMANDSTKPDALKKAC